MSKWTILDKNKKKGMFRGIRPWDIRLLLLAIFRFHPLEQLFYGHLHAITFTGRALAPFHKPLAVLFCDDMNVAL